MRTILIISCFLIFTGKIKMVECVTKTTKITSLEITKILSNHFKFLFYVHADK
jgi:hypothetical protein